MSLLHLGILACSLGDYASARAYYDEGLTIQRDLGDRQGIAHSLLCLGTVACSLGDYTSARACYEESLTIQREVGDRKGIAYSLYNLGDVANGLGDYASARAFREESLTILRTIGDRRGIAYSLDAFADLAVRAGRSERAVTLLAAAELLREQIRLPLSPTEREQNARIVGNAREALTAEAFSAAWEEGRAMTWEQAVAYALEASG